MFTGLIESVGMVRGIERHADAVSIAVEPHINGFSVADGGSVAVNGACLSLERREGSLLYFTAVSETLRRTTLGTLRPGDKVNLERSLRLDSRLEGHFVLGHIDGVGKLIGDRAAGESVERRIQFPPSLRPYMAIKGSVTIDGISLTIANRDDEAITVALIPQTLAATTMLGKRPGDSVNIECDVLARYIFQMLHDGSGGADSPGNAAGGGQGESLLSMLEKYRF
jgi:riboflavin synthase